MCERERKREREKLFLSAHPLPHFGLIYLLSVCAPYLKATLPRCLLYSSLHLSVSLSLAWHPLLPLHLMLAALAQLSEVMFTRSTLHVLLNTHTQRQAYKIENDPLSNVNSKVQIIARVDKMLFRLFMWLPGKQLCLNKKHTLTRDVRVTRHNTRG